MKIFFPAVLLLFMMACNNAAETKAPVEDTSQIEDEVVADDAPEIENAKVSFQQLFSFLEERDSSFNANQFQLVIVDSMELMPAQPIDETSLKPYYPYLVYNTDSSKAIDLHSYNTILVERKGKVLSEAAGPDTEIALIDFTNKTRQRLLFVGPSSVINDGKWINDHIISIAGGEIVDSEKFKPEVWLFDINAKKMKVLSYADTLQVKIADYKKQSL